MTLSAGGFAGYSPDFKINWIGSKNNYDLVSQTLTSTPVPAPSIGHGLMILIAVDGMFSGARLSYRRTKRRPPGIAVPQATA